MEGREREMYQELLDTWIYAWPRIVFSLLLWTKQIFSERIVEQKKNCKQYLSVMEQKRHPSVEGA